MADKSREFQVFVKPAGAVCNLRCTYCYYLEKCKLYPGSSATMMSEDVLESYIRQHIEASTEKTIFFSWHGGEPLMAGMEFYRKAVEIQKRLKSEGKEIFNGIQTNGTLINEVWCRFFLDENFVVGISIDGPGDLHNRLRKNADRKGSLSQVLKGYELLTRFGINTEILCVVSSVNVKFPLVVYDFFRQLGCRFITFLPLVVRDQNSPGEVSPETVNPDDFGTFLINVFDEWLEKDIGRIKVQIFEEALRSAFNQGHTLCIFKKECGGVPVVEHNGDFYACDHFVDREHHFGNILEESLSSLLDSERQASFGRAKYLTLPVYCRKCEVLDMCNGECPKNRFMPTPDGEPGLNYLCSGYKKFFKHCIPFINILKEVWKNH